MKNPVQLTKALNLVRDSLNRSPWRRGSSIIPLVLAFVCFALSPTARAISPPPDTIFVSNFSSSTIEKFALTGTDLGVFVTTVNPTGLAFDNAGNLYVANDDPNGYAIEKFTPTGAGSVFANSGLSSPLALAFDRAGNLYVANAGGSTIEEFTPSGVGTVFADAGDGVNNPLGLAFDSAGNLFVSNQFGGTANTGTIEKFTPDGIGSIFADGLNNPYGLAFDSIGNLYVAIFLDDTIEKFTPDGGGTVFANTGLFRPIGLLFDSAGNLYAANENNTIEKFSPTGTDLGIFASTGLSGPQFLAIFRPSHLHFEIEALRVQASSAGYRIVRDANASGGAYGLLGATTPGDFVTYRVPIVAAGTYDLKVGIQTRNNKGIFQLAIAGVNQGTPQDEYSSTVGYEARDLGTVTFTSVGNKAFKFTVTGHNPSSHGYTLAFDYIDLDLVP